MIAIMFPEVLIVQPLAYAVWTEQGAMIRSVLVAALMSATPALAQGESARGATPVASPYAGQQMREIKSLSAADIEELERGGG